MEKVFTAWLWQAMYDSVEVLATSQDEADEIAQAWVSANYPKGEQVKKDFPQIVSWQ
jgi:hypothetical protein